MAKVILFLSLLFITVILGEELHSQDVDDTVKRIVGGDITTPGQLPYMVSIQQKSIWDNSYAHFCGGAILNEKWVLTAGHCVSLKSRYDIRVVAGEQTLNITEGTEQIREIEKINTHYKFTVYLLGYDIALLKLSEPLDLTSKYVSAIDLPSDDEQFTGDCTASGWGYTEPDWPKSEPPAEMHFVTVSLQPHDVCKKSWPDHKIQDHMICAGNEKGGKDICIGDSGGPLVCTGADGKKKVAGVVSFTNEICGTARKPSVYTSTASFYEWIKIRI